jgi:hypothetical protein
VSVLHVTTKVFGLLDHLFPALSIVLHTAKAKPL